MCLLRAFASIRSIVVSKGAHELGHLLLASLSKTFFFKRWRELITRLSHHVSSRLERLSTQRPTCVNCSAPLLCGATRVETARRLSDALRVRCRRLATARRLHACIATAAGDREQLVRPWHRLRMRMNAAIDLLDPSAWDEAPLSRSWTMNPLMAMDCIACAVMPTAAWLTPVAVQNRITRSCAVSGGVVFAIVTSATSFSRTWRLARRRAAVRRRAAFVLSECDRPEPRPTCGGGRLGLSLRAASAAEA